MCIVEVFQACVDAMGKGELIERESSGDKEFHFQNWFKTRLLEVGLPFEQGSRNSYPDFRMVRSTEGFELKGLAYPGRDASFDSNSQMPTGFHNGRTIYYVFGRYPRKPDGNSYPVLDLVVCHGDLLNADHEYVHQNKSVRGFGSYGDILIRDRKMYVVPTPFHLADGVAHQKTLILPAPMKPGKGLKNAGSLTRVEANEIVVGYTFNLLTNELVPETVANPQAGLEHHFRAWRLAGSKSPPVTLRSIDPRTIRLDVDEGSTDD